MSRSYLIGLLLASCAIFLGLTAAAVVDFAQTGAVPVSIVTLIGATVSCLVVVLGILASRPGPTVHSPHCHNCGTRVYPTLRSLDRREVLTCFACGSEWALPVAVPREVPRPPELAKPTTIE